VALDFTLPGSVTTEQNIARLDLFDIVVDQQTGHIEGTASLRLFDLDAGPSNPPDPLPGIRRGATGTDSTSSPYSPTWLPLKSNTITDRTLCP
jgi:hypothetical protein